MSTGSNAPSKKSHPFNISGVVEVSEILAPSDNRNYTYRHSTISITCNGLNNDNEREYDGTLTGYSGAESAVVDDHCYTIKGRMLPSTDSADFQVYFDPEHKVDLGESEAFAGTLHDNTAASGFGIVGAKTEVPDLNSDSAVLVFVMKHTDYRPEDKATLEFDVEYRMRPTPNLKRTQGLVQEGKETLVHGYIVDWSEEHKRWIVDVTGLNVASGHQAASKKKVASGSQVTATGRVKPAKHTSSPAKAAPSTPKKKPAAGKKGKTRAAAAVGAEEEFEESVPDPAPDEPQPQPAANKKRPAPSGKGKARAAPEPEPEDYSDEDGFDNEFVDETEPAEQGTSTGRGTKAGRQPKRPRAV